MKKSVLALLLIAAMILSLTACSTPKGSIDDSGSKGKKAKRKRASRRKAKKKLLLLRKSSVML